MNAILLLAAMVSGQTCGPLGCSLPPATVLPAQVEGRDYYVFRIYSVQHDGLTFDVKGYMKDGKVTWKPSDPFNACSWQTARENPPRPKPTIVPVVRPEKPPTAVPGPTPATGDNKPVVQVIGQAPNYGMEPTRMNPKETYTATSPEGQRFVQEAKAGEVGGKLHVTVIGSDDERAPVVNDLMNHPAFADLKPSIMVQDYTPSEWQIDPALGFVTTGKPTILVQTTKSAADPKGGKVVLRAADYSMGAEALAEEIRKANPNYRPSADPTPQKPAPNPASASCPLGFTRDHWPYILAVGIGTFLHAKLPRKGV